jgi:hypothetical protein
VIWLSIIQNNTGSQGVYNLLMGKTLEMDERPGRTFELWGLIWLLLLSAMYGFQRLGVSLYAWDTLQELGMQPGPLYTALSGGIWGLASLVSGAGLFFGWRWAPAYTRVAALGLAAFYWVDRLALTRSAVAQVNEPFAAGLTVALVGLTFGILALNRQRRYFHRGPKRVLREAAEGAEGTQKRF